MNTPKIGMAGLLIAVALCGLVALGHSDAQEKTSTDVKAPKDAVLYTDTFPVEPGELVSTGRNPYFILEPGYSLHYKKGDEEVTKVVLNETKKVDGVETRVIEERETKKGVPLEVARNFYAISKLNNSVYYFGEEVDFYKDGKIDNHEGAWLSGVGGARFGLMMPGTVLLGARHYQEIAPKVAEDRAEIVSMTETVETHAGTFKNCVKVLETNPLEPEAREFKWYARGVGLVKDDKHELVKYGFLDKPKK